MNRPQLKVIEGSKPAPGVSSPVLGLIVVSVVTFIYGALVGFVVARVWF